VIAQVAEDFSDHASADEDEGVVVAVGAGGAGQVGHECHLIADVAEFGEFFFQQQVVAFAEGAVFWGGSWACSIALSHATRCTWREGLICRGNPARGEGICRFPVLGKS
jgi:hypothetical protein